MIPFRTMLTGLFFTLSCWRSAGEGSQREFQDIPFLETDSRTLLLDLFLPEREEAPPLIIYIHGGGWSQGSHKNVPAKWLVKHGYAVSSISYRYSKEAFFPAQIHDCKAALRWLRAHAKKYGFDPDRVGVMGESAGAQLALLLGTNSNLPEHEGELGNHRDMPTGVSAVVSLYGASDFILRAKTQPSRTNQPHSVVVQYLGASPLENEQAARLASAAFHVSAASAPLLVIHGSEDGVVLPDQSERIVQVYHDQNLEAELIMVNEGRHRLDDILNDDTRASILTFFNRHLK